MKAIVKVLMDFVAWRWAPTVALVTASLVYVLVVIGLVPSEIQVPLANPKFNTKPASTATAAEPAPPDDAPAPPPPSQPASRTQNIDFGRRGFSPPLARPDPPPPPPPPPAPPPPVIPPPAPPVAVAPPPPSAEVAASAAPVAAASVTPAPPSRLSGRVGGLLHNVANALQPNKGAEAVPAPSAAPSAEAPARED